MANVVIRAISRVKAVLDPTDSFEGQDATGSFQAVLASLIPLIPIPISSNVVRVVSAATDNPTTADDTLLVTRTAVGTCLITLFVGVDGKRITIKDTGGLAGVNNITITGPAQIDNAGSLILATNFQSVTLQYSSELSKWSIE